jgi:hypothetical protein
MAKGQQRATKEKKKSKSEKSSKGSSSYASTYGKGRSGSGLGEKK